MRKSGVLMPVASLPGKYGIGTFSKNAYKFIDKLKSAGQSYWQILPLGPTGYGDSPYQSFSTFAGNPYFIDLETLIEDGLLTKEECDRYDFGRDSCSIDYEKIYLSERCIIPMQDYLALGNEARINTPSTLGGNWVWRMKANAFTLKLAKKMHNMTKLYSRL